MCRDESNNMLDRLGTDLLDAVLGTVTAVDPAGLRALRRVNKECRQAAGELFGLHVAARVTYHTARLDRCDALYHKTRKSMVSDLVTGYRLSHVVEGHREALRRQQAVLEGLRGAPGLGSKMRLDHFN